MEDVRIVHDPIEPNNLISFVHDPSAGAISSFIGTTRDNFESFISYIFIILQSI